ncbi:MAG: DVU_1555 family C-GCAxxG-C-C protein [Thermodesulfobacteriota bacterium]
MPTSDETRADMGRMAELAMQGFHCSDVLLIMGLEAQGKENPDLIRTVGALAGGVGFTGDICGAFTGGACLLGLYAGRGSAQDDEDPRLRVMIAELDEWFTAEQTDRYGGIHCRDIIGEDPQNIVARCPRIVGAVYRKVRAILAEHGFEWHTGGPHQDRPPVARSVLPHACPVASRLSQGA